MKIDFQDEQINELFAFLSEHFPNTEIKVGSWSWSLGAYDGISISFKIAKIEFFLSSSSHGELDRVLEGERYNDIIYHEWNEEFRNYLLSLKK